jgi:hypothetical protein
MWRRHLSAEQAGLAACSIEKRLACDELSRVEAASTFSAEYFAAPVRQANTAGLALSGSIATIRGNPCCVMHHLLSRILAPSPTWLMLAAAVLLLPVAAQANQETVYATGFVFHDRNSNGVRDPGEEGLGGVRVSNQREIVETDEEGRWRLPVEEDDTIFFVIKPTGWMTPVNENNLPRFYYIHKPHGSPPELYYPGVAPTGPLPESIDFPLRPQEEPEDFRVIFVGDPQARTLREVDWMRVDSIPEMSRAGAAFGVTLGDIVHNQLWLFQPTVEAFALAGIPWYNVIGNHDINFDATEDRHASSTFQSVFGPPYYSFEYGNVHFMALDNIRWHHPTPDDPGGYFAGFGPRQMEFIRNDLARVPADRMVVLMMHIQYPDARWAPYADELAELLRLVGERPHSVYVAGHRHRIRHRFLGRRDGWPRAEPLYHLIVPALGGGQWGGHPDALGIPGAVQPGGSPRGYFIFNFQPGPRFSARFKASRRPEEYQMNLWAPQTVPQDRAGETEVFANVFAATARSTVEMRLREDGDWRPMAQTVEVDPFQMQAVEREARRDGLPAGSPGRSEHLWKTTLPEFPPIGAHTIHVRTTDMFGQTWSDVRSVTVVPGVTPGDGSMFADASEGLRIDFASDSPRERIRLILNGEDRAHDLAIEGDRRRWQARLDRLQANRFYDARLEVGKENGRTISYPFRFDTFDRGAFRWLAADYNFDGGGFLASDSDESYRDRAGVQGVDMNEINFRGIPAYRPADGVGTQELEDERMRELGLPPLVVNGMGSGEWLNYTRDFPSGRFHVFGSFLYGRTDGDIAVQMDRVTSDPSQPDQETEKLGVFRGERNTGSWWDLWFYPLLTDDGELAVVELDSEATLRVTNVGENSHGVAYYLIVPVEE